MRQRHPDISLEVFCRLVGKSRQAYYFHHHKQLKNEREHRLIIEMVSLVREELPMIGGRKLFFMLSDSFEASGIKIGRDKFFDLLRVYGLLIRRRKRHIATTLSSDGLHVYPNLIKNIDLVKPNQLWVSDITYIRITGGFNFLSIVTDAYSKLIIGYELHLTLHTKGCVLALDMALRTSGSGHYKDLIHHSDRGIQYCSTEYINSLNQHSIEVSMSEKASPQQNAIAERVNGILKHELGLKNVFKSHQDAQKAVNEAIYKYNSVRPHSSCNYLTPEQAHLQNGEMKKRWKNYSKKKYPVKPF